MQNQMLKRKERKPQGVRAGAGQTAPAEYIRAAEASLCWEQCGNEALWIKML